MRIAILIKNLKLRTRTKVNQYNNKVLTLSIVDRVEWLWSVSLFCYVCVDLTVHNIQEHSPDFSSYQPINNQWTRQMDCVTSESSHEHNLQNRYFYLWCLLSFISSLLYLYALSSKIKYQRGLRNISFNSNSLLKWFLFCNAMHTFYNLLRDSTARHKKKIKKKTQRRCIWWGQCIIHLIVYYIWKQKRIGASFFGCSSKS